MSQIQAFNSFVPSNLQAPSTVYELLEDIENIQDLTAEVKQKIKAIKDAYLQVPGSLSNYETPDKIEELVSKVLDVLPEQTKTQVMANSYYQAFSKALNGWRNVWNTWLKPIGLVTDEFEKSADITKTPTSSVGKVDFTFNFAANAQFSLSVVQPANSAAFDLPTALGEVLINQEITAGVSTGVDASTQIDVVSISAGLSASGSGEFDAFYQLDSKTPTYKALWDMYKKPLIPWSLTSMDECLVEVVGDATHGFKADGYRAMTLKTQGSLTLNGKIEVGKSISTIQTVGNKDINIGVTLGGSFSRTQSLKGNVAITVSKVAQGLLVESSLNDNNTREDNLALSANASIQGLDQLASQYVSLIIDKGNKVVNLLEKYSRPGDILKTKLLAAAGNNDVLTNLAKLVLGEQSASDAVKAMLSNDLQTKFNNTPLSTQTSASELATTAVDKLLTEFDVTLPTNIENINTLRSDVETRLTTVIEGVQETVTQNAEKLIAEINNAGAEALKPLETLGEEVNSILTNINNDVQASFDKIINAYTSFRSKIENALQQSANIKLGLLLEQSNSTAETEKNSYNVVIKDASNLDAALLYKCLILGDGTKAAKLISTLPASVIEVQSASRRFDTIKNSKTSLSINIANLNTLELKDVSSQLSIEMDGNGNLTISQQYNAAASSTGFSEYRKAVLNLTYGIANASSVPTGAGTFGLSYANDDEKLHTTKEMKDLLNSLILSNLQGASKLNFGNNQALPELVSQDRANAALQKYNQFLAENKYTKSSFNILMAQTDNNFSGLLNIDATETFNFAMEYLVTLTKTSPGDLRIALSIVLDVAIADVADVDNFQEAITYLIKYNNGTLRGNVMESQLEDLKGFKDRGLNNIQDNVANFITTQYDWEDIADKLNDYNGTASSIALLGANIKNINQTVKTFLASGDGDLGDGGFGKGNLGNVDQLNTSLNQINDDMNSNLENWVNVNSSWTNLISEFLSFLGAQSSINVRFLSLLFLLQQVVKTDDPLYLITISLKHKSDSAKDKRIIV